jgi:hypothetical protein
MPVYICQQLSTVPMPIVQLPTEHLFPATTAIPAKIRVALEALPIPRLTAAVPFVTAQYAKLPIQLSQAAVYRGKANPSASPAMAALSKLIQWTRYTEIQRGTVPFTVQAVMAVPMPWCHPEWNQIITKPFSTKGLPDQSEAAVDAMKILAGRNHPALSKRIATEKI